MDLPEIRQEVARHVLYSDLRQCALVCHDWNATFTPPLYQFMDLRVHEEEGTPLSWMGMASLDALQRNGHFIQHMCLTLPFETLANFSPKVRDLRKLWIESLEPQVQDAEWGQVSDQAGDWLAAKQLLNNSDRLTDLSILNFRGPGVSHCLRLTTDLLGSQLTRLHLSSIKLEVSAFLHMLRICQKLDILHIGLIYFSNPTLDLSETPLMPNLKSLEIMNGIRGIGSQVISELPSCCRNLESLKWHEMDQEQLDLRRESWPNLSSMDLEGIEIIEGNELADGLAHCCPGLKTLNLQHGYLDTSVSSWKAPLLNAFAALTRLDIFDYDVDARFCLEILSTCLNLEYCGLPTLDANSFTDDGTDTLLIGTLCITHIPPSSSPAALSAPLPPPLPLTPSSSSGRKVKLKHLDIHTIIWSENKDRNKLLLNFLATIKELNRLYIWAMRCDFGQDDTTYLRTAVVMDDPDYPNEFGYLTISADEPLMHWKPRQSFKRPDIERDPELRWMIDLWPNLQSYDYGEEMRP
ncbi:hypothetical protein BGZ83_009653 [Gryganskiella cystojenkinii]|nr:hypothetical protein BGZ83_009653 [Gryganskiella cystojenkinii]